MDWLAGDAEQREDRTTADGGAGSRVSSFGFRAGAVHSSELGRSGRVAELGYGSNYMVLFAMALTYCMRALWSETGSRNDFDAA